MRVFVWRLRLKKSRSEKARGDGPESTEICESKSQREGDQKRTHSGKKTIKGEEWRGFRTRRMGRRKWNTFGDKYRQGNKNAGDGAKSGVKIRSSRDWSYQADC